MGKLITVVTVVYNAKSLIDKTLDSVCSQTFRDQIEYIVIDGSSKDGTLEILQARQNELDLLVSEPDKGIYDAMNKGARLATGRFINFMNAGDTFINARSVEDLFADVPAHAELVYADTQVIYDTFIKYRPAGRLSDLDKYFVFYHQTLFVRTEILRKYPFDTSFEIAGDYHFVYNCYQRGAKFHHVGIYLINYASGGKSEIEGIKSYKEAWSVVKAHNPSFGLRCYHGYKILKQAAFQFLRWLLPSKVFLSIIKFKNTAFKKKSSYGNSR